MKKIILFFLLGAVYLNFYGQTKEHKFNVVFKGKDIGHLFASEKEVNGKILKDLRTNTSIDIIALSVHVESEVKLLKQEGVLIQSTSYRHASRGSEEILAHIKKIGEKEYDVTRNKEQFKIEDKEITYCTVDLYFIEPKSIDYVFSSMLAEFLKIEEISPGKYKLISPNSKDSYYTYKNGKLMIVEIDTPFGLVTCNLKD